MNWSKGYFYGKFDKKFHHIPLKSFMERLQNPTLEVSQGAINCIAWYETFNSDTLVFFGVLLKISVYIYQIIYSNFLIEQPKSSVV